MWRRGVCAEEQTGDQTNTHEPSNVTGEIAAPPIQSAKPSEIPVRRKKAVGTENATGPLPEIGNDHDIGLVVSGASFDPSFPFTHIIGCAEIGVAVSAPNLQATEFVNQEEVDHASDRVRSVHCRRAILEDVN